jgi:hypothetical protein
MDPIYRTCAWLQKLRGRPVVVLGDRDAYLFQEGNLLPLGCPACDYRTRIRQIGAILRARGLSADYAAYRPVEHWWGLANQATLDYGKQVFLLSSKPPLAEAASL